MPGGTGSGSYEGAGGGAGGNAPIESVVIGEHEIKPGQIIVYKKKGNLSLQEIYVLGFRKDHYRDIVDMRLLYPFIPRTQNWMFQDDISTVVLIEAENVPLELVHDCRNRLILESIIREHTPQ